MVRRVKLSDVDYSEVVFGFQAHEERGYHTIFADLVTKPQKDGIKQRKISADRFCIFYGKQSFMGEKVPDAVYSSFCNAMDKSGSGNRVMIKKIVEEEGQRLQNPILAVGVTLPQLQL